MLGFPADSSYSNVDYGANSCDNPSSDVRLGRDYGISGDGDRTRSKDPDMVGSLRIHSSEDDEVQPGDNGGDDDDDGDGHVDEDEPVPVAHGSSSGGRPAPRKEKGLTGSFISVMNKIAGSRQKRPEKSHPTTHPTQRKKAKNDSWEQARPTDGGPQDPVLIPSYSGNIVGSI
ncbi:hypothetical protein M9H77_27059 [Catharanthus roseus]|uniref:Uncharacterized protein n=1 Tax=Catharanthus roseus TaxID=4058 RepID=A0ACC0ACG0_CATRO|nr:hypothetical protein M9H77_27059 [Catharanthus roseus]